MQPTASPLTKSCKNSAIVPSPRKVGPCARLDDCACPQLNAQETRNTHEPPSVRLFCRPRLRALPESDGSHRDANCIMTGKSTFNADDRICPPARHFSLHHQPCPSRSNLRCCAAKFASDPMK